MDKDKLVKEVREADEEIHSTAGERRAASYSDRVRRWWNSKLHGTRRRVDDDKENRVLCTVKDADDHVVVRAEGRKSRKRSAQAVARATAIGELYERIRRANGGKRVHVDVGEYEFTYKTLEG